LVTDTVALAKEAKQSERNSNPRRAEGAAMARKQPKEGTETSSKGPQPTGAQNTRGGGIFFFEGVRVIVFATAK